MLGAESRRAAEPQGGAGASPRRPPGLRPTGGGATGRVPVRWRHNPAPRGPPSAARRASVSGCCAAPPSGCLSPNLCSGEPARPREGLKGTPQVPAVWPQEDPSMDASRRGKGPPSRTPAGCPAPSGVGSASRPRARAPGPLLGRQSCHRPLHKLSRPLAAEEALRAGSPGALLGSEFVTPAPRGPVPFKSGSEADQADVAFGVRLP